MTRFRVLLLCGVSAAMCQVSLVRAQPQPQTSPPPLAGPSSQAAPAPAAGLTSPQAAAARSGSAQAAAAGSKIEEVVVTAQRRSERLQRTPVSVQVLSSATLRKQVITSDRDLQVVAPGLTVRASQNANELNYALRGQTVDEYTSSLPAVLPYVNEVPAGGVGQSAFYDLQSIQVLKGPQGTLFGRNATGGAVLFTTAKPTEDLTGYGIARFGNFGAVDLEGAVSGAIIPDKLLLRVAGTYNSQNGYQHNLYYDNELGGFQREGVRVSVTAKPTDEITNDFVIDFFEDRGQNIVAPVSYVLPASENSPGYPFVPNNVYIPGLAQFAQQQAQRGPYVVDVDSLEPYHNSKLVLSNITRYEINDDLTFKNVFGFVDAGTFDSGDLDGTPYGIDGRGTLQTGVKGLTDNRLQVSEEPQLLGTLFDKRLSYVVGAYADTITDNTTANSYIESVLGGGLQTNSGITTSKSAAVYGQGTFDTGFAGFKVIGGIRYTVESVELARNLDDLFSPVAHPNLIPFYDDGRFISPQEDTFRKISWTVGVQNQVTSNLLLYVTSRHSFRSGGFNFYTPPTPGFAETSGGEFEPEVATDIEGGAKYNGQAGDLPFTVNLAVYNQWVSNVQRAYYEAIYGGLGSVTVNVPEAQVTGFELDGSIRPTRWLTLGGNVNYTDARFTQSRVAVLGTSGSTTYANFDTYPDTPKWSVLGYADVTVPVTAKYNVTAHGDVYYQTFDYFSSTGESLNPGTIIPPYAVANFRLGLDPASGKGLSLAGVVKNALDRTYYTGGIGFVNLFGLNIHVPAEPRSFLVELGYRF